MLPCAFWIAEYRRTEARACRRTRSSRPRGRTCALCVSPTGRMKCTWNRLRSGSWPKARNRQEHSLRTDYEDLLATRRTQSPPEKLMPPLVVSNPQSLKELVGKEIGVTEWFHLTQERIALFAEATEDRQWIHLDQARANEESPYGATIAHGFLTLSLISHFLKSAIQIQNGVRLAVNYGFNRWRFSAAVHVDSRIRARVRLLSLKELSDSVEAKYNVTIRHQTYEKPPSVTACI